MGYNVKKGETEKSPFSKLEHLTAVVSNLNKAVEYYQALGIGLFESTNAVVADRKIRGKPTDDVKLKGKMGHIGQLGFGLDQPVSGESLHKEFLETRGEGIHHLGFVVDDLEKETARLIEKGFKVISSWRYAGGGGGAYFNTDRVGGVIFELLTGH